MTSAVSRTFKSGNSEALRLPRGLAFGPGVELTLVRSGDVLTIYPSRPSLASLIDQLDRLPRPSAVEVRDCEPLPEPRGL